MEEVYKAGLRVTNESKEGRLMLAVNRRRSALPEGTVSHGAVSGDERIRREASAGGERIKKGMFDACGGWVRFELRLRRVQKRLELSWATNRSYERGLRSANESKGLCLLRRRIGAEESSMWLASRDAGGCHWSTKGWPGTRLRSAHRG